MQIRIMWWWPGSSQQWRAAAPSWDTILTGWFLMALQYFVHVLCNPVCQRHYYSDCLWYNLTYWALYSKTALIYMLHLYRIFNTEGIWPSPKVVHWTVFLIKKCYLPDNWNTYIHSYLPVAVNHSVTVWADRLANRINAQYETAVLQWKCFYT